MRGSVRPFFFCHQYELRCFGTKGFLFVGYGWCLSLSLLFPVSSVFPVVVFQFGLRDKPVVAGHARENAVDCVVVLISL